MKKLINASDGSEFNLWFEYDLFCQVNMWFVISIINSITVKKVYAVYSKHLNKSSSHFWNGFGPATAHELLICFDNRILLNEDNLELGKNLWQAYKNNDLIKLKQLSLTQTPAFPYLQEVVQAHIDRFPTIDSKGRPERVMDYILKTKSTSFNKVFEVFNKTESIYGFGDTQVKLLYDNAMNKQSS